MKSNRSRSIIAHVLLVLAFLNGTTGLYAQQQQPPIMPADGDSTGSADVSSMALSASALTEILQERPELVVELKRVAADRLTAQGIPTQEDSITDEMLYSRIATDAALRSAITVWLRARGYPSAETMAAQQSDSPEDDTGQLQSEYLAQ